LISLIRLITQYLVDVYSHLPRSTVGSYGQHINVFLDYFAAATELNSGLVFGAQSLGVGGGGGAFCGDDIQPTRHSLVGTAHQVVACGYL
jgi:hypothetical protein